MVDITNTFNSVFNAIGGVTKAIRGIIDSTLPNYAILVYIGLAVVGGYYLAKKYPRLDGWWTITMYTLVIFLVLRFV